MAAAMIAFVLTVLGTRPLRAQDPASDTMPSSVVQRFVDGANARNLDAMASTLAPGVTFRTLPTGAAIATGRDDVRAYYARLFAQLPRSVAVHVASRLSDGPFVVDFEQFTGTEGNTRKQATWIYHVTGGRIQNAWALRQDSGAR